MSYIFRREVKLSKKNKKEACVKKCSIGGQALIEGIMMRGPKITAMAVRNPEGEIVLEKWATQSENKNKIITKDTPVAPANCYGDSKVQAENGIRPLNDESSNVPSAYALEPELRNWSMSFTEVRSIEVISSRVNFLPSFLAYETPSATTPDT